MNASVTLLERSAAAVVGLHSQVPATHPSVGVGLGSDRVGSGTLIDSDGLILTVNYLVMGAKSIVVSLLNGEQYDGRIVAQDYISGLALVRIARTKLPYLEPVSSSTLALGQDVFTVSSVGSEGRRADSGMVSYLGPFDALWEFVLERCLMTSAMNFGVGGGPLCSSSGGMVGISYLSLADIGRATLAIPSECLITARDELLRSGRRARADSRAWIGLLSYTLREHVVIAGVMPGGPGDKAGLRPGDVVLEVDGRDVNERRALYDILWAHRPGDKVNFKIFRNNQVRTLEICGIKITDYFG